MITKDIRVFTNRGLLIRMAENLANLQPTFSIKQDAVTRSFLEVMAAAIMLCQSNLLNVVGCKLDPNDISADGETQGVIEVTAL